MIHSVTDAASQPHNDESPLENNDEPSRKDDVATGDGPESLENKVASLEARNAELEVALARKGRFWSLQRGSSGRRVLSTTLIVLGAILLPISILTVWTAQTVTNTNQYVATVAPLASNPAIQSAVTDKVTNRLYESIDPEKLVGEALPPKADQLVGPISSAIKGFIHTAVARVVASAAFERIWTDANRVVHKQVVGALEGTSEGGVEVKNGAVQLDLGALATTVKQRLVDSGLTAAEKIPTDKITTTITLFQSTAVQRAQRGFQILKTLGIWLPFVVILLFLAGIWTARDRRRAVIAVGLLAVIGALILAAGLALTRSYYLSHIPAATLPPAAAAAAFDILVHFLKQSYQAIAAFGLLLALGAYVIGPSRAVRSLRSGTSRTLQRLGARAERERVLPSGLRTFFGRTMGIWDVALVVAAVVALVLWRSRTVLGVIGTAILLLLAIGIVEILGRREVHLVTTGAEEITTRQNGSDGSTPNAPRAEQSNDASRSNDSSVEKVDR